jgi:hypothetical protein
MRKLTLEIDALAVESFDTTAARADARGTVRGLDSGIGGGDDPMPTPPVEVDACTCNDGCLDPTNAYYCATAPATMVSCQYTRNLSCDYR